MAPQDVENFKYSNVCWLCDNDFYVILESFKEKCFNGCLFMKKVRDHDHLSGKYRGAAHNECNLQAKQKNQILFRYFFTTSVDLTAILFFKN